MAAPRDADIGGVERAKKKVKLRRGKAKAAAIKRGQADDAFATTTTFLPNALTGPAQKPKGKTVPAKPVPPGKTAAARRGLAIVPERAKDKKAFQRQPDQKVPKRVPKEPSQIEKMRAANLARAAEMRSAISGPKFVSGVGEALGGLGTDIVHSAARDIIHAAYKGQQRGGAQAAAEAVDQPVNVSNKVLRTASEWGLGPNITHLYMGEPFDKSGLGIDLALLSVPGKGLPTAASRLARLGVQSVRAAKWAKEARALETPIRARDVISMAVRDTPVAPVATAKAAAGKAVRDRQWRNGLDVQLGFGDPRAASRSGKLLEDWTDKNRELIHKMTATLTRDVTEKAGHRAGTRLRHDRQVALRPAIIMQHFMKQLKGTSDFTAMRLIGEQADPMQQAEYHIQQAVAHPEQSAFHKIQAELAVEAGKYVETSANGTVMLKKDAPKRLHDALYALRDVAESREDILKSMGKLTEDQIRSRINAPGAMLEGAQWVENATHAMNLVRASPARATIRNWLINNTQLTEPQVNQFLNAVGDPGARSYAQNRIANLKKDVAHYESIGDPSAAMIAEADIRQIEKGIEDHYSRLGELFLGQPGDRSGIQQRVLDAIEAEGPPEHIDYEGIADKVMAEGLSLPPHMQTREGLVKAIQGAYQYLREGEAIGGRDWYERAANEVKKTTEIANQHSAVLTGKREPLTYSQVAQLYAISSTQTNTITNVTFVKDAIQAWMDHGHVWTGRYPRRQSEEMLNVLHGKDWHGRKRSSFYMNIIEGLDKNAAKKTGASDKPVTVDMWIARIFGEEGQPTTTYDGMERIVQEIGQQSGMTPKEAQAAMWVGIKDESIKSGKNKSLAKAGAADAYEYGGERSFGQMSMEGMSVNPYAKEARTYILGAEGGATLNPNLTIKKANSGYYTSYGAYEHKIPARKFKAAHLEGYAHAHDSVLGRGNYVGAWHNPEDDMVYLDVSRRFNTKQEAIAFAQEQGQVSIYDAKKGDAFDTPDMNEVKANAIKSQLRSDLSYETRAAQRVDFQQPLKGLPEKGSMSKEARSIADAYMASTGMPYVPPTEYRKVYEDRARAIADEFEKMVDALSPEADPAYAARVLQSYVKFAEETVGQYDFITKAGYTFEFYPKGQYPYPSPWDAMRDLKENKHLYVFPTDEGFGQGEFVRDPRNPMLADTGLRWMQDGEPKPVYVNDLFRGVHDFFGHFKEGVGFRADGEENAWRSHAAMYSDEARGAMTTETRGQNSWVNYGPNAEFNKTANEADTIYAEQKLGLMPDWTKRIGATDYSDELKNAQRDMNKILDDIAEKAGFTPNADSRRWAEDHFWEHVDSYPGAKELDEVITALKREADPPHWLVEDAAERKARGFIAPKPGDPGRYILGMDAELGDISTLVHEWGHFMRYTNLADHELNKLAEWAGYDLRNTPEFTDRESFLKWREGPEGQKWMAAEEKIANAFEVYVLEGGSGQSHIKGLAKMMADTYAARDEQLGPASLRKVIHGTENPNVVSTYRQAGLKEPQDRLPGRVRDVFDFWLSYEDIPGGAFQGAEGVRPGLFRVPYPRGLPISLKRPWQSTRAMVQMRRTLSSGRGALGAGPDDPQLRKAFKGVLKRTGFYSDRQIAKASTLDLQKAVNMATWKKLREALLATDANGDYVLAMPKPTRNDDLALKIDPSKDSPKELQAIHDMLRDMEGDLEKPSIDKIAKEDWQLFERMKAELFPDSILIDGEMVSADKAAAAMRDLGEKALPLPNIVWVPKRFLDSTGLFDPPTAMQSTHKALEAAKISADILNDLMKVSLLYLNPAYYGMNMVGNLTMNLIHQGAFAPHTLARSFMMSHQMGPEAAFVDFLMGHGLMSVADLRAVARLGAGQKVSNAMSHWSGIVVDMIPRRAAFLHEARRLGYKRNSDLERLFNNADDLYEVTKRAKEAMVNFDEMGKREREILARYIFVYPWLKGATMQTFRLPKEHPILVAGLMFAYSRQQALADDKIGPRPTYLDLVLPIGTAERYGHKYPLVLGMRQVFTAATPYEIGMNILKLAENDPSATALSEMLAPWYGSLLTHVVGYDPFKDEKVDKGFLPMLKDFLANVPLGNDTPLRQRLDRLMASDEELQGQAEDGRLYPRNKVDNALGFVFGSVAPTPINPETARRYSQVGPLTAEQKVAEWSKSAAEATGQVVPESVVKIYGSKKRVSEIQSEIRKREHTSDLTDAQNLEAKMIALAEMYPEYQSQVDGWVAAIKDMPDGPSLDALNAKYTHYLGWRYLKPYEDAIDRAEKADG